MSDSETRPAKPVPANMLEIDFALVLARMIEAAKTDPVQLRGSIYELARQKLRDQFVDEDPREMRRMMEALDTAIQGVEQFSQRQNEQTPRIPAVRASDRPVAALGDGRRSDAEGRRSDIALPSQDGQTARRPRSPDAAVDVRGPAVVSVRVDVPPQRKRSFLPARALLILIAAGAILSAAIYLQRHPALLAHAGRLVGMRGIADNEQAAAPRKADLAAPAAAAAAPSDPLLPKTFGIYAISGNQLFELEPLPGRAPDTRVAMSAAFHSPSRTTVPDGKVRFVVYRRDSVSNTPDRAEVRVIAQVVSAMTFESSGKPKVSTTEDNWVIRNIAINYRVAPFRDNPDMYEIRHESDDFILAPGRYAMVIKGAAYDFTVAGAVADSNHCLERIEAANGAFYGPCQKR